ncbi:MAG: translational GTPase TypA [Chlorobi bacterium]|nr:translational GTPase TypA [Chlorobiota bacterium]
MQRRSDIRNIAIIAHVDHGKTTLVDQILRQAGLFRQGQVLADRLLDSNALEREKGITIMAKNTAVRWKGVTINIVDTPGHADFGGEVERALSMVDGVLVLVDAAEGPLPQTKFVVRKAIERALPGIIVINKIDRSDARPRQVLDEVHELFLALGAGLEALDMPVLFAVGRDGIASRSLEESGTNLIPLFETIVNHIPAPSYQPDEPFQMIVAALDWNDYVGRLAIGRIHRGRVRVGDDAVLLATDGSATPLRITKLFTFEGLERIEIESAEAGDIVCLAGIEQVRIGDTIASPEQPELLPPVVVDEPTVAMHFMVNASPLAGKEGKYVTTPKLRDRLWRELRTNVSLRIEETDQPDVFRVLGRGELQMAVLIETMRREGYEVAVSQPEILFQRDADGRLLEPIEHVVIDVPSQFSGNVIEALGRRRGEMLAMVPVGSTVRIEFSVPARGLLGFRTEFMTLTRGEGVLHHTFAGHEPYRGEVARRTRGSLVALEDGIATAYALESIQERGMLFITPGERVYEGMVIGEHAREGDLVVNPCKTKHLTNMRSSGSEGLVRLAPPRQMTLEQYLEFLNDDELLEVTPLSLRVRKRILNTNERQRHEKRSRAATESVA